MPRITDDFLITGPVEFLDVNVERDNLLFLDPSAIRAAAAAGDSYALKAAATLNSFFDRTLVALASTSPTARADGESDLQQFSEIGETRLGMSRTGYRGRGAAAELGTRIWNELDTNPLCKHTIATLKYIEDIPVFVEGIDKDILSDITVRIVFETLEQFTTDMVTKYPTLRTHRPMQTFNVDYWNNTTGKWANKSVLLPSADGKPLLLVPKNLVNYKIEMTFGQYHQVPLLGFIMNEELVEVQQKKGVVIRPKYRKKELKTKPEFARSRRTNTKQTERIFLEKNEDLLGHYRAERQRDFEPLTEDQLDHYLSREP